MKTLLVPTDFSESADNALNYAIEYALQEKAKIILLHSDELDYQTFLYTLVVPANETIKREAHKLLDDSALRIARTGSVAFECVVSDSPLTDAILETCEQKKVDLIIMGTKGAQGLKKFLVGSNTSAIIEKANCPVLAIPEHVRFKGLRQVTYATNFLESDLIILKKLFLLLDHFHCVIQLLHMVSEGEKGKPAQSEKQEKFLNHVKSTFQPEQFTYSQIVGEDPGSEFEEYMRLHGTDLLVMNTEHRYLTDRLFEHSLSKELSYHAKVPLMVFHHAKQPLLI